MSKLSADTLFQSHIGAIRIRPDKAEFDANLQLFAHFSKS